ncbi:T9SS type A sorting domain-containing protein [Candidatus Dependentiae bacterium]|nr:T9SS type A sorting domain-containing protein [Candidatus Dependentiae bacterium]
MVFKATLSNGLTLYCNSSINVKVKNITAERYIDTDPYKTTIDIKTLPNASAYSDFQDKLQIRYSLRNPTRNYSNPALRKLRKPLIYVEGYDVNGKSGFKFLGNNYGEDLGYNLLNLIRIDNLNQTENGEWVKLFNAPIPYNYDFMHDLDDIAGYDLVFVNYNTMRSIQDNALMLQRVIEWVNSQKASIGSTEKNVVLGVSMGGLVARYCLAQMTRANFNSTDTKLLITHDSPHQGANVPLGFQYFLYDLAYSSVLGTYIKDQKESLNDFLKLNEKPSTQQLLKARATDIATPNPSFPLIMDHSVGTVFNTFLNGSNNVYHQMVDLPANQRPWKFVATSQGSQCGINVFDGSNISMANQDATFAIFRVWGGIIFGSQYWLNTNIKSLPVSGSATILNYKFERRIKILGIGFGWKTMKEDQKQNPDNYVNWDGSPGGTQSIRSRASAALSGGLEAQTPFWISPIVFADAGLSLTINQDVFSFVSTTSSLDAPEGTSLNTSFNFVQNGLGIARVDKFIAQEYFPVVQQYNIGHTDYTRRNAKWIYNEMENILQTNTCEDICALPISITGPEKACGGIYTVPFTIGAIYNWQVSPTGSVNLINPSTPNEISVGTYKGTYGIYTIVVNITDANGCNIGNGLKTVELGLKPPYPAGPFDPQTNEELIAGYPNISYYFQASETSSDYGPFTYTWKLTPPNNNPTSQYFGPTPIISFPSTGYYTLSLKKQSSTCNNVTVTRTVVIIPNYGGFVMGLNPNPASSTVTISYGDNDGQSTASKGVKSAVSLTINIYNQHGVRVFQKLNAIGKKISLDISMLPNGVYIVEGITNEGRKGIKKMVIQR